MNTGGRQLLLGALAVMLSLVIVTGSLLLSLVEGGMVSVLPATLVSPTITSTPTSLPTPRNPEPQPTDLSSPVPLTETPTPQPTATQTPLPPTNCPPPPGWIAIQTGPGDTFESIAAFYETTVDALKQANCLMINQLLPGSRLYVPPLKSPTPTVKPPTPTVRCGPPTGWIVYIVQPGDTLFHLSQMFNVSVYQLQVANCLTSERIQAGQRLYVPNLPTWTPTIEPTFTPIPTNTPVPTDTPDTNIPG